MTSNDKLHALITATRYIHDHAIAGDIVECGVWRGGSMHAVARVLDAANDHARDLYLFDTFEGMPPPTEKGRRLIKARSRTRMPASAPKRIALLRLDTDWYESTRHELEHLYPRLVSGGVLIIDDYGWWQGSHDATEEFLRETGERLLLVRAGTGRIAVTP
jgi:O-methyltransferase